MSLPDDRTLLLRPSPAWVSASGHVLDPADTVLLVRPRHGVLPFPDDPTVVISRRTLAAVEKGGVARLLAIAGSFLGTQLATSVLGAAFWSLSARMYPVAQVGIGSAAIASMNVLGTVGMLGMGTLLMTRLPMLPEHARPAFLRASLVVVTVASAVLGLVWAVCTHWLSATLRPVGESLPNTLIFSAGVVLYGVTSVLDQALLAAAGGLVQLVRNLVASIVKLVAIPVFIWAGMKTGMSLYLAWTGGLALSLPVCYRYLRRQPSRRRYSGYRLLRQLWRDAVGHHMLNMALQMPMLILPVVAALVTTSEATARFTAARLVASFFFVIPFALPMALLAQSGGSKEDTYSRIRMTVPLGLGLNVLLYAAAAPLAGPVLSAFGKEYADAGAVSAFRIMTLAGVAFVIKDHYVAIRRVEERMAQTSGVILVGTLMEISFAAVGGYTHGIVGLCWGWLAAVVIMALVVTPPLLAALRRGRLRSHSARLPDSPPRGQVVPAPAQPSRRAAGDEPFPSHRDLGRSGPGRRRRWKRLNESAGPIARGSPSPAARGHGPAARRGSD